MGFNFPNSPALNDTYAPVGGPVFTWDGTAWKGTSQGAPVTVYVSDTAPLSPAIGQLWWNSATGTMAIWYADADSAQWVQVSGQVLPTAPSDDGEYVMVNGVWRLVRQSFNLAGLTQQDLTVPAWGPTQAQLTISSQHTTTASSNYMQVSIDGTTFLAGTSYGMGGFVHYTGTSAFANYPSAAFASIQLTPNGNHTLIQHQTDMTIVLVSSAGSAPSFCLRGEAYNSAAANLQSSMYVAGYVNTSSSLKALRWYNSAVAAVFGRISVEWLA